MDNWQALCKTKVQTKHSLIKLPSLLSTSHKMCKPHSDWLQRMTFWWPSHWSVVAYHLANHSALLFLYEFMWVIHSRRLEKSPQSNARLPQNLIVANNHSIIFFHTWLHSYKKSLQSQIAFPCSCITFNLSLHHCVVRPFLQVFEESFNKTVWIEQTMWSDFNIGQIPRRNVDQCISYLG